VGAWSDRLRSRWGRRHPFMLAAILPLGLSFAALFSPPDFALTSQASLFYWLLASVILLRTALTVFMVPYLALGAEITSDYHERTWLASMRTNLGWFLGVLAPASAMLLLFNSIDGVDGRFEIDRYRLYGWFNAAAVVVFSLLCIVGTWHYIPDLLRNAGLHSQNVVRDILQTFRNRNFRQIVVLETALGGMGGITSALLMITFTYFWELEADEISLLMAGPIFMAVLLVSLASPYLNRSLEKQQLLRLSCILGMLNLLWLTPLKLFDLLPGAQQLVFALIFVNYGIYVASTILRTVSSHALLADIADEHDLASGQRQEGIMFAAAFFAAKFISGFGYLVAGPLLDLIGLEAGAQPGQTPASVDWGLGLIMGPGLALLMLIPVWMAYRLDLSHAGQQRVQAALRARAAAD
ncbi:MAG: MFS transporter, partial [Halioglobus sp.]|nr:MFS transporter [Halioglobus sp.]